MDTAHCQPDVSELPAATAPHPALPRGRASAGMSPALLSRTRDPTRTPNAMRYVSYHPRVASARPGGRWLRWASPPPNARPRPWLTALMRGGVCGGGSCAPETQHTRQTQCGTCRTAPAWPLVALIRPGGAGYVDDHHLPHARSRPRLAVLRRAGCARGRILCSRHLVCAPEGTSHVPYNPTSARGPGAR